MPVIITSFKSGFASALWQFIKLQAGSVGTELEVSTKVRIPVYKVVNLTGVMKIGISRVENGYKLKARPDIGLSLGTSGGGKSSAFLDFLAGYSIEIQAATGPRALSLLSLALEAEVRGMKKEPPPLIVSAIFGNIMILDLSDRTINWIRGKGFRSSFWPLVADGVWGRGHMEQAIKNMLPNEFAETVDEGSISGSASSEAEGMLNASVSLSGGYGDRRRIERKSGDKQAILKEDKVLNIQFSLGVGAGKGKADFKIPLDAVRKGGTIRFTVGATFSTASFGVTKNLISGPVLQLIRKGIQIIEQYSKTPGQDKIFKAIKQQLHVGEQELLSTFADTAQSAVWNALAGLGLAKRGFEISATLDIAQNKWDFALFTVDKLKQSVQGTEFEVTRKQKIYPQVQNKPGLPQMDDGIKNQLKGDLVYEWMAHKYAYKNDPLNKEELKALASQGYEPYINTVIPGKFDFQAWLFKPLSGAQGKVPVIAFRGSQEALDWVNDLASSGSPGMISVEHNMRMMNGVLGRVKAGRVDVTGHSLGGALAQLFAVYYPDKVRRIVTFQSPGIPDKFAAKIRKYNSTAKDQVFSHHYRAEGDIVDKAGDAFTPGNVYEIPDQRSWSERMLGVALTSSPWAYPVQKAISAHTRDSLIQDALGNPNMQIKSHKAEGPGSVRPAEAIREYLAFNLRAIYRMNALKLKVDMLLYREMKNHVISPAIRFLKYWDDKLTGKGDYSRFIKGGMTLTSAFAKDHDAAAIKGISGHYTNVDLIAAIAAGATAGPKQFNRARWDNILDGLDKTSSLIQEVDRVTKEKQVTKRSTTKTTERSIENKPILTKQEQVKGTTPSSTDPGKITKTYIHNEFYNIIYKHVYSNGKIKYSLFDRTTGRTNDLENFNAAGIDWKLPEQVGQGAKAEVFFNEPTDVYSYYFLVGYDIIRIEKPNGTKEYYMDKKDSARTRMDASEAIKILKSNFIDWEP